MEICCCKQSSSPGSCKVTFYFELFNFNPFYKDTVSWNFSPLAFHFSNLQTFFFVDLKNNTFKPVQKWLSGYCSLISVRLTKFCVYHEGKIIWCKILGLFVFPTFAYFLDEWVLWTEPDSIQSWSFRKGATCYALQFILHTDIC